MVLMVTKFRTGFTSAPQILISSGGDGNDSIATASVSSGEITSISVSNGGSGYSSAPEAIVIGGPHLLRITDTSSAHYGRVFLITNNTTTTLDLDFSILANGETATASDFLVLELLSRWLKHQPLVTFLESHPFHPIGQRQHPAQHKHSRLGVYLGSI